MYKKIMCIMLIIAAVFLVSGCGKDEKANFITSLDPKTKMVRDGHLNEYPNIKIGDAYDAFFSNPQWKYFEGKNGEKVVEFSGNCIYEGKEINVRQQFVFQTSDKFEIGALSFNEISQNKLMSAALMKKIYESYGQKNMQEKANPEKKETSSIQKAQAFLDERNIKTKVLATSLGNASNGYISLTKNSERCNFVICDIKNQQIAEVPFAWSTYGFVNEPNKKTKAPVIFLMKVFKDKKDRDVDAGVWKGNDHWIPTYALYEFDANNKVVPGMLTTGAGERPSHYQGALMEQKNVDMANLLLTEMAALQENVKVNKVDMSFD